MRDLVLDPRARFLAGLALWSVGLLAVLRSPAGQRALVAPFAAWHAAFAVDISAGSAVAVDLSCSGSDVIALSVAAILAFPVSWRRRLSGLALALVWLACLNLARIVSLVNTAGSPLFAPLHTYVWPALMIGGSAAFVFGWMWRQQRVDATDSLGAERWWRPLAVTALLVVAYVGLAPRLLVSDALQAASMRLAVAAAAVLNAIGLDALTGGSTLVVSGQSFLITPECLITPLMPVYLAWAATWPRRVSSKALALGLFVPAFVALGFLRLLTVALPAIIGPPLFLTHGFYQFVSAIVALAAAARLGSERSAWSWRSAFGAGLIGGFVAAVLIAVPYRIVVDAAADLVRVFAAHTLTSRMSVTEVQGALPIMPGFVVSLLCATTVAAFGRESVRQLLALVPIAFVLQVLLFAAAGEMSRHWSMDIPVTFIRALSIVGPFGLTLAAVAWRRHAHPASPALQPARA